MSIAANYRSALRGRSRAEFAAKLGIVVEEADETQFWLELLKEGGVVAEPKIQDLLDEATELVAIFVAARQNARK